MSKLDVKYAVLGEDNVKARVIKNDRGWLLNHADLTYCVGQPAKHLEVSIGGTKWHTLQTVKNFIAKHDRIYSQKETEDRYRQYNKETSSTYSARFEGLQPADLHLTISECKEGSGGEDEEEKADDDTSEGEEKTSHKALVALSRMKNGGEKRAAPEQPAPTASSSSSQTKAQNPHGTRSKVARTSNSSPNPRRHSIDQFIHFMNHREAFAQTQTALAEIPESVRSVCDEEFRALSSKLAAYCDDMNGYYRTINQDVFAKGV